MKERPILFSGAMVRAILEGRKTMTRRVVKEQREHGGLWFGHGCSWSAAAQPVGLLQVCPYGQPGDRLWVRETWAAHFMYDDVSPSACTRKGEGHNYWFAADPEGTPGSDGCPADGRRGRWRPSIHMPRWASRLTLEVTDVSVQRLQEITEEDARAEGVDPVISEHWTAYDPETEGYPSFGVEPDAETIAKKRLENVRHHGPKVVSTAREQFQRLWDSINAPTFAQHIANPKAWAADPWVWWVSFRRVA